MPTRTGGYWFHRSARAPHPATRDPVFQQAIIERLETRIGIAPAA
ncbi:hypothetical protein [Nocardioides pantholopis]|nr:hypothetical protein [Nocardioides pantholopis]